jgi:CheY-like chemotaxis protein
MLSFARKRELKPGPVSLPRLIVGMIDLLDRSLGPQIRIETRFAPDVPDAFVDGSQMELAILNLAVNARDAMPHGGKVIIEVEQKVIGAGGGLAPGGYVRVCVTDTGTGMDEETLKRAMEPFFSTKGEGKGTGLGLSMVHDFAAQSCGQFNVRSAVGRGTSAEILLPQAPAVRESTQSPPPGESWSVATNPLTVLAVDDDPLVLVGIASMLADLGHQVISAGSGREALTILRTGHAIDVVVTDQAMPDMTGTQLWRSIESEYPRLPVILVTGHPDLPESTGQAPMFLKKPFTQEQLSLSLAESSKRSPVANVVPLRADPGSS